MISFSKKSKNPATIIQEKDGDWPGSTTRQDQPNTREIQTMTRGDWSLRIAGANQLHRSGPERRPVVAARVGTTLIDFGGLSQPPYCGVDEGCT